MALKQIMLQTNKKTIANIYNGLSSLNVDNLDYYSFSNFFVRVKPAKRPRPAIIKIVAG
jgi:hypothetical protein